MLSGRTKSFKDLYNEVIITERCNRCGGCVSFCSANNLGALEFGEDGYPRFADQSKCLEGGLCYLLCPQIGILDEDIKDTYKWKYPQGNWEEIFSSRSTDANILKAATDGGVVSSLLNYMLDNHIIDGAIVSHNDLGVRTPTIAYTRDDVINAAGSFFTEAFHLDKLGDIYASKYQVISVINEITTRERNVKKLALVGTPCQIHTIRKMQELNIVPSDLIIFTIGLFCMQCFTLEDLVKRDFAAKHNINIEDIEKVNIKEKLILQMKSGITINIPLTEIEQIARPACLACSDFANDYSDISAGGLGSDDGYTTIMVRSTIGREVYSGALNKGYIENAGDEPLFQNNTDNKKIKKLIHEYAEKKHQRAQRHDTIKKS